MGRGGGAGLFPIAGGEERGEGMGGALAFGDFEEGASEIADHFVEESVAFEFEAEAIFFFDEVEAMEGADGIVGGGAFVGGVGEGGEVVGAEEALGGGAEGVEVEGAEEGSAVEARYGVEGAGEVVVVDLAGGAVAGMEIGRDFCGFEDPDVGGEERVGREAEARKRKGGGGAEMGGLPCGVDAGVSSARSGELDGMAEDRFEGTLDESLDREAVWLHLPAGIASAVVGEGDLDKRMIGSHLRIVYTQMAEGARSVTRGAC